MSRPSTPRCAIALSTLIAVLGCAGCKPTSPSGPVPAPESADADGAPATAAAPPTTLEPVETTADGAPRRRDGWWRMASLHEDGSPRDSQSLCVGAGSEDRFNVFEQMTMFADCSQKELTRSGAGWRFETRCDIGSGMTSESKGTISGNFRQGFRVEQTILFEGSTRAGAIVGEWKGECPAAYKPGDLVDKDGDVLMNLLDLGAPDRS